MFSCSTHYSISLNVIYKKSLSFKSIKSTIKKVAEEISERYEIQFEHIMFENASVHILCSFHVSYSIDQVIKKIKDLSQREIFLRMPHIKEELWGANFWSNGYSVETVGANIETARSVIQHKEKFPDREQLSLDIVSAV